MKRTVLTLACLAMIALGAPRAWAQYTQTATLSVAAGSCTVTGTTCLILAIPTFNGGATLTVSANASANTIQFEASGDGANSWVALNATPSNSSTAVTSTTSTGTWQANVAGYTHIRLRMSTLVGGTTTVAATPSSASARAGGGSGPGGVLPALPTTPNSVPFSLTSTPSGGVGGPATWSWPGITVTSQTGATYQLAAADRSTCIEINNAGLTVTIPDAGGTNFQFGYVGCLLNIGSAATINNTSSSKFNLFGSLAGTLKTTFTLFPGQEADFFESPNNNWEVRGVGGFIQNTLTSITANPPLVGSGSDQTGWAECYNPGTHYTCIAVQPQAEFHTIGQGANSWLSVSNAVAGNNASGSAPDTASIAAMSSGGTVGGTYFGKQGTCSAITSITSGSYLCPDATTGEWLGITNGSAILGMMVRRQPAPVSLTAQSASVTNGTQLCAAAAGACNIAGQYRVTAYFDTTTAGTGNIVFNLTWTDETGPHTAQTVPMDVAGATSLTGNMPLTAANNATATTSFWSTGASQIGYGIVYTSTGSYAARIIVERLQ